MFRSNEMLSEAEIASFCQQINMIIKAGFPIYYGIALLRDDTTDDRTRELLTSIYEPMESGSTLYQAISTTGVFPNYMLQMVRVGEETGRLEEVLTSLTVYYEREADIRAGIRQAISYPLILSVMMLAVIIVIITKVVPIFSNVYAELGSDLTGTAKVLLDISSLLNRYMLPFVVIVVVLAVIVFLLLRTPFGKRFYERTGIALSLARSRFANCMYLALASGLDTDQGFLLAESLVENSFMAARIRHCHELIKAGGNLSNSLLDAEVFSKIYSSLITIGYKTSAMDDVMLNISKAYEKETDERLSSFISVLEPTLIIILSFFIGLILISFLLPLLGIMSSIG